jgi:hypothetical protein
VDTAQRKLAFQVQFWGLIGPLIALITLLVIFIKSPPQAIYLSMATIVGLLVSWKWKIQGFAISIGFIALLYLYQFGEISPDEHLWHIGMNFSIALGFVITALAYKEVEQLLHPLDETLDHKNLNPSIFVTEINLLKQAVQDKIIDLQIQAEELAKKNSKIQSYESLVETVKVEVLKTNSQHEKLLEEFFEKQNKLSLVEEKLYLAEENIKILSEKSYFALNLEAEISIKSQEIANLKERLKQAANVPSEMETVHELKSTNELLSRERGRLETLLFRTQIELHQKTQDLANLPDLERMLEELRQEKENFKIALNESEIARQDIESKLNAQTNNVSQLIELELSLNTLKQELTDKTELHTLAIQEKESLASALIEAESSFVSLKTELAEKDEYQALIIQEKESLASALIEAESSFASLKQELAEKDEYQALIIQEKESLASALIEAENSSASLKTELAEKIKNETEAIQEKEQQVLALKEAENKLVKLEAAVNEKKTEEITVPENEITKDLIFNFKKIEGKYNQLREQFELKSEVLNETRRALFNAEERLMQLKLDQDEKEVYDLNETASLIQEHTLEAIQYSNEKIQGLQAEVDALQNLLSAILLDKKYLPKENGAGTC